MKYGLYILCIAVVCGFVIRKNFSGNNENGNEPAAGGKLYIQSSIVGGLRMSWLYLGNDGVFVKDPRNGVNPVNYALEKANNAANTGHYTATKTSISAKYENGKTESWPVEYLDGRLNTIDGLFISQPAVMPAGHKIAASYSAGTFYGNVANIRKFNFSIDGSFTLESKGYVNNGVATGAAKGATGGTYNITGNTIKLNFNNGESSVAVIGIYKAGKSSFLVINESYFAQN